MWLFREEVIDMKKFFAVLFGISIILFFVLVLFFKDNYLHSGALHLGMFSAAMYFLWKSNIASTLKNLGIPGNFKMITIYTFGGMFLLFALLIALSAIIRIIGIEDDSSNVMDIIQGLPWYIPALAIVIAPITEELFFRGLLVPKIGVLGSALFFGLSHAAYGSIVEVLGAFLIAILFGLIFKYSKSLTPCILVHFGYNLLAISVMLVFR